MPSDRVFGEIVGYPPGSMFVNRKELAEAGVHKPTVKGISGSMSEGADSIVISGGYEDDDDFFDEVLYTGAGGNDPDTKKQIADQEFTGDNAALAKSCDDRLPVRVTRGRGGHPEYSPAKGFRYDGLYFVSNYWLEEGKSGFKICRYRLVRDLDDKLIEIEHKEEYKIPVRKLTTTNRIERDKDLAESVKRLYDHKCQICGVTIETPGGKYAESAHIKPLGRPHNGPDSSSNVLCLCPNDHIRFDKLVIYIDEALNVRDCSHNIVGALTQHKKHNLDKKHFAYHRTLCGLPD